MSELNSCEEQLEIGSKFQFGMHVRSLGTPANQYGNETDEHACNAANRKRLGWADHTCQMPGCRICNQPEEVRNGEERCIRSPPLIDGSVFGNQRS